MWSFSMFFWDEEFDNGIMIIENSIIANKIYTRWVKTDVIIGFLAPENIGNDHIFQNFRPWAENNFTDFY